MNETTRSIATRIWLTGLLLFIATIHVPSAQAVVQRPQGRPAAAPRSPSPAGMGIRDAELTDDLRQQRHIPSWLTGVSIEHVYGGSPASQAGLHRTDVVTSIDGAPTGTGEALGAILERHAAGDRILVAVWRDGGTIHVPLILVQQMTYLPAACEAGDGAACNDLSAAYAHGTGVPVDGPRSRALEIKACDLGFYNACTAAGLMFEDGEGGPVDQPRALAMYTRGCANNVPQSCVNAAIMHANGTGTTRDPARAAAILRDSCSHQFQRACTLLAELERQGAGTAADVPTAITRLESSCSAGDGFGCVKLGDALLDPRRQKQLDYAGALKAYVRACERQVGKGCVMAGRAYAAGKGVPKNEPMANALYVTACTQLAEPYGCALAGIQFAEGAGVAKDADKARQFLGAGCAAGYQDACERLLNLRK